MRRPTENPKPSSPKGDDVVYVGGASPDGATLAVLRKKGQTLSMGVLRRAEEGKPVHGELLRLAPRAEDPQLCDVEVLADARAPHEAGEGGGGPAQVSTPAYREGWNAIFGARATRSLPN